MSIALIHTLAQAEAAAAGGFPWVIVIILGVFVILGIALIIPSRNKQIESDKDDKKKLPEKDDKKLLKTENDGEETESDKAHMSLAEIKDAKRQTVSENHTKDELRELRKERRAATQTANAIHERENMAKSDDEEDEEEISSDTEIETEDTNLSAETEDNEKDKITAPIDDIITKTDAGASDVFASLFGNKSNSEMNLEFDEPMGDSETDSGDVFFPMLGSKLIPLNELTAAAAADDNNDGVSLLDGLTKKIADNAEKKL